jgi:hypothetical protein
MSSRKALGPGSFADQAPLLPAHTLTMGNGADTPVAPSSSSSSSDELYKRKRPNLRSAEEGLGGGGGAVESEEEDEEVELKGWPTRDQLTRRVKIAWTMLRFGTVVKILAALIVCFLLARSLLHRMEDRNKATHFSIVALLRDMSSDALAQDRWQFAFQWSALMSWSAVLLGRNILVFVDSDETCTFLEGHVRGIQCFVIPPDACFHPSAQQDNGCIGWNNMWTRMLTLPSFVCVLSSLQ